MWISYKESRGRLQVSYQLQSGEWDRFPHALDFEGESKWLDECSVGFVPSHIRQEGEDAILAWAKQRCEEDLEALYVKVMQQYNEQMKRMRAADRPIVSQRPGRRLLRGHVVCIDRDTGRVHLDEPFHLKHTEKLMSHERFALGTPMFEWDGRLTKKGHALAIQQLERLYDETMRRRRYGKTMELAERLNKRSNPYRGGV